MRAEAGAKLTPAIELVSPLGAGGMGTVWRAFHAGRREEVAVKLITDELSADPEVRERFAREARAAMALDGPHVVRVFESGLRPDGAPFIVMELCRGETLRARLGRGPLALGEADAVFAGIAAALARAHRAHVVHRDVKPDNVFLEADGPKLGDFGIAKHLFSGARTLTATGAILGTPAYMSPEQMLFATKAEPAYDLWACAVVGYEMVTGHRPFLGADITDIARAVCAAEYEPASRLGAPPAFDAFFERAFALDPGARFAHAEELAQAFRRACVAGERTPSGRSAPVRAAAPIDPPATTLLAPGAAPAVRAPERGAPRGRATPRTRALITGATLALAVAAGALVAWRVTKSSKPSADSKAGRRADATGAPSSSTPAIAASSPSPRLASATPPLASAAATNASTATAGSASADTTQPRASSSHRPLSAHVALVRLDPEAFVGRWRSHAEFGIALDVRLGGDSLGVEATSSNAAWGAVAPPRQSEALEFLVTTIGATATAGTLVQCPGSIDGELRCQYDLAAQARTAYLGHEREPTTARDLCAWAASCSHAGECVSGSSGCEAASDDDCAVSMNCALQGFCRARERRCVVVDAADCALQTSCLVSGKLCRFESGACVD